MIRAFAISLKILGALAATAALARAGCEGCEWADRGDRWEGVQAREKVSGGSFELLSVRRRGAVETVVGERMHLAFWLPEPAELDEIVVRQPAVLYRMEPARRRYEAGRQQFAWPRGDVIDPLRLAVDALHARVRRDEVFFPALLTTGADAAPDTGYAFVFMSGAGVDAVCTIARHGEDGATVRRFDWFEDAGGTLAVEWDGRDDADRPVPAGAYVLTIEGDMLAETVRPLRHRVVFWHSGKEDDR